MKLTNTEQLFTRMNKFYLNTLEGIWQQDKQTLLGGDSVLPSDLDIKY